MIPVYATRDDGWPLCPMCHEDELYSLFDWDGSDPKPPMQAWIDHGVRCYRCGWDSQIAAIHATERSYREGWDRAIALLNSAATRARVKELNL